MLIYKQENILKATENIICHQVNVDGIMGGGLAKQIASVYPMCEIAYTDMCKELTNDYDKLKGKCLLYLSDGKRIANCFTQKPNFDTDYEALKECFTNLMELCKYHDYTICVPYKYGCGIANGEWEAVESILNKLSDEYKVNIVVYRL